MSNPVVSEEKINLPPLHMHVSQGVSPSSGGVWQKAAWARMNPPPGDRTFNAPFAKRTKHCIEPDSDFSGLSSFYIAARMNQVREEAQGAADELRSYSRGC